MEIPLPRIVSDVGPGGPFATSMGGINALLQGLIQSQYLPSSIQSKINSQNAFANLAVPQLASKVLTNHVVQANSSDEQKNNLLKLIVNSVTSQAQGGNNVNNNPAQGNTTNQNPMNTFPAMSGQNYSNSLNNIPQPQNQQPQQNVPVPQDNRTWSEKTGEYEGNIEQGKESGKIRAKDISEFGKAYTNSTNTQSNLDSLSDIVSSPAFQSVRQIPMLGRHEIAWYAMNGTPEQKNVIGQTLSRMGQIVTNASQNFKGVFRAGEQRLIETMKPQPGDTLEVMEGKIKALSEMNKILGERSRRAAELMDKEHYPEYKASEIAAKEIGQIIQIRNKNTGQSRYVTEKEAKEMTKGG